MSATYVLHPLLGVSNRVVLSASEQAIGRSELGTNRKLVSKVHLRCQASADGVGATITDCSVNGTYVNGVRLPRDEPRELRLGDVVTLLSADSVDFAFVLVRCLPAGSGDTPDDDPLVQLIRRLLATQDAATQPSAVPRTPVDATTRCARADTIAAPVMSRSDEVASALPPLAAAASDSAPSQAAHRPSRPPPAALRPPPAAPRPPPPPAKPAKPATPSSDEAAGASAAGAAEWFFVDASRTQKHGPMTFEQLAELYRAGDLQPQSLVWSPSLGAAWLPAADVAELVAAAATTPVPPAADRRRSHAADAAAHATPQTAAPSPRQPRVSFSQPPSGGSFANGARTSETHSTDSAPAPRLSDARQREVLEQHRRQSIMSLDSQLNDDDDDEEEEEAREREGEGVGGDSRRVSMLDAMLEEEAEAEAEAEAEEEEEDDDDSDDSDVPPPPPDEAGSDVAAEGAEEAEMGEEEEEEEGVAAAEEEEVELTFQLPPRGAGGLGIGLSRSSRITEVHPGKVAAEHGGLLINDLLLEVNGQRVRSGESIATLLPPPTHPLTVRVSRVRPAGGPPGRRQPAGSVVDGSTTATSQPLASATAPPLAASGRQPRVFRRLASLEEPLGAAQPPPRGVASPGGAAAMRGPGSAAPGGRLSMGGGSRAAEEFDIDEESDDDGGGDGGADPDAADDYDEDEEEEDDDEDIIGFEEDNARLEAMRRLSEQRKSSVRSCAADAALAVLNGGVNGHGTSRRGSSRRGSIPEMLAQIGLGVSPPTSPAAQRCGAAAAAQVGRSPLGAAGGAWNDEYDEDDDDDEAAGPSFRESGASLRDSSGSLGSRRKPNRLSVVVGRGSASMFDMGMRRQLQQQARLSGDTPDAAETLAGLEEGEEGEEGVHDDDYDHGRFSGGAEAGDPILVDLPRLLDLRHNGGRGFAGVLEERTSLSLEDLLCALTSPCWQGVAPVMALAENSDTALRDSDWDPSEYHMLVVSVLAAYKAYLPADRLLAHLTTLYVQLGHDAQRLAPSSPEARAAHTVRERVLYALLLWVRRHPDDFSRSPATPALAPTSAAPLIETLSRFVGAAYAEAQDEGVAAHTLARYLAALSALLGGRPAHPNDYSGRQSDLTSPAGERRLARHSSSYAGSAGSAGWAGSTGYASSEDSGPPISPISPGSATSAGTARSRAQTFSGSAPGAPHPIDRQESSGGSGGLLGRSAATRPRSITHGEREFGVDYWGRVLAAPSGSTERAYLRELAEQLALHEAALLRAVMPSELQGLAFAKPATKHERAPNVQLLITHFNRMSRWVCTQVVKQATPRDRARCLRLFIDFARLCHELGNYNAVMEIVAALNSAALYRLKRTWDALKPSSKHAFDELGDLVKPERSHAALRHAMRVAARKGAAVPYLGLYLSDLTFIEDGNADYVASEDVAGERLVNLGKIAMLGKAIGEVLQFQQLEYQLEHAPKLAIYFTSLDPPDDDEIYALSLACEPREGDAAAAAGGGAHAHAGGGAHGGAVNGGASAVLAGSAGGAGSPGAPPSFCGGVRDHSRSLSAMIMPSSLSLKPSASSFRGAVDKMPSMPSVSPRGMLKAGFAATLQAQHLAKQSAKATASKASSAAAKATSAAAAGRAAAASAYRSGWDANKRPPEPWHV